MREMVDIIIHAYNAHDTIVNTLLSVCMQVCKLPIKIYIIDDCSNKKYDYLKDMFKEKLDINIYRNKNKIGPGQSRNIGLSLSKSEYVFFLDSNKLLNDANSLYNLIKEIHNNDIALGTIEIKDENGTVLNHHEQNYELSTALFKRHFLNKNKIVFPESLKNEDKVFMELCLLAAPKIGLTQECITFYQHKSSRKNKGNTWFNEYKKCESLINNSLWIAMEARKREFNMNEVIAYVENVLIYLYFTYQAYYYAEFAFVIFEWIKPLIIFYNKYKKYTKPEITNNNFIFQQKNWQIPTHTSWKSFLQFATHQANIKTNPKPDYKKDNSLISIIMPVYNREKYLRTSLDSVLNQTYKNLEIIVIDDCSKDNSRKICEEYAKKDKRIKYIKNRKNKGVAETRNVGLAAATGEYIGFVDSDDSIEKNMFEKMIKTIKETKADFVQCSAPVIHESDLFGLDQLIVDGNKEIMKKYFQWNFFSCMVWDKLFTKEIISDTRFKKGWQRGEDAFFATIIATKANRAVVIPDILYNYTMDTSNSLSKKFDFNLEAKYMEINRYLEEYIGKEYPDIVSDYYRYKMSNLCWYIFDNLSKKNIPNLNDDNKQKYKLLEDTISTIDTFMDSVYETSEEYYVVFVFSLLNKMARYLVNNKKFFRKRDKKVFSRLDNYLNQVINIYIKTEKDFPHVLEYVKSKKHDRWIIGDICKKYTNDSKNSTNTGKY